MINKNVPEIRFPEFTDDWELRKLGELGEVTTGKAFSSTDFDENGEYLIITNKDISDSSRSQNTVTDRINTYDNIVISKYNLSGENLLVTMDGVNLGKTAKYSNNKALLAQRVGRIQSEQIEFVYQVTANQAFLSMMRILSVGNAIKHISLKQIADYKSLVPNNNDEQTQIGNFFKQLDNTIALHQHKLNILKQTKQGSLQKMFPKEGESVPELRFPGFTDDWELRELGTISNVIDPHPSHRAPVAADEGIPFIGIGDIDEIGNISYKKVRIVDEKIYDEHHDRYDLSIPSIGIGRVASLGKVIRLRNDIGKYAVSPTMSVIQFNIENSLDFLYAYMNTPVFQRQFKSFSNGSTRQSVGIQDLRKLLLKLPKCKDEQAEIGSFFNQVNNTIALHQRELDLLKETKKGFLQKLFV